MKEHLQSKACHLRRVTNEEELAFKFFSSPETDLDITFIGLRPLVVNWVCFRFSFIEHGYLKVLVLG